LVGLYLVAAIYFSLTEQKNSIKNFTAFTVAGAFFAASVLRSFEKLTEVQVSAKVPLAI